MMPWGLFFLFLTKIGRFVDYFAVALSTSKLTPPKVEAPIMDTLST